MKNSYPLFLVLIFFCFTISAQSTFQVDYQVAGILNIPGNIIQNPAGQYVIGGSGTSFIPIRGTVTVIDSASNVVWSKGYSASIETEINDIKNVTSGGYIVTGASDPGLVLMRLTSTGAITWANTYHFVGTNSSAEENGSKVLPTSDGGFVVAGYIYQVDPDGAGPLPRQDSANCYCLKVNSSGVLQWAKIFFMSTAYINDHVLNDVAEVSDGYVFGGSMSQGQADADGTYALLLKTDFNGNLQWVKRWGGSGNSDAECNALSSLSANQVLVSGDDNSKAFYTILNSTGTGSIASGYQYAGAGFLAPLTANYSGFPTNDGNYGFIGSYFNFPGFYSYVLKVNPANGNRIIGDYFTSPGQLSVSILPIGRQVADSGYAMVMTAEEESLFGFDFHVVKTNAQGTMNVTNTSCPTNSFNPTKSSYTPATTAVIPPDTLFGSTTSSFSPAIINNIPKDTVNCISIICSQPPAPSASASVNPVCPGGSTVISGIGSGTVTYNVYTTATGGNPIGTAPLTVNPGTTTTYYVEASSGTGCVSASRGSVTVTVTSAPGSVGAIAGNTAPCPGAQAYSISAVSNATSYLWAVSGGGTVTSGGATTNATVTWTSAGTYTITVTASNSCGNSTATLAVTVSGAPGMAVASALPNPACAGQNVALSATSSGASAWAWSGPNSYTSASQGPTLTSIQANQAGNYTVTASNTCGSVTASVNVVVNPLPTAANATANPNPACQGTTVSLTGSATSATTWSWTGPNAYTSSQQSPQLTNVQANEAGVYTLVASNTCGHDTATVNLAVNTAPTNIIDTASPNPVCVGSTLHLNGSAAGATSYSWSGPNGFSVANAQTTLLNFQNVSAGVYTLSAINTCGTATASVTVNIATSPVAVSATSNTTSTCYGTNIQLTGAATGAASYSWSGPNGFTSNQQDTTIANSTVADSGAYILTATNNCGSTNATVVINVDTLIEGFLAASVSGDTLCTGYQLALVGSGINVNSWAWTGPNGFSSSSQDTTVTNAALVNNGQYILKAANACGTLSDTLNVYVENGSVLNLVASSSAVHDSACYGNTINLFATDSFDTYQWAGPNGFVSMQQNPIITNAGVTQSGVYYVTATNHCGQRVDSVHVYIDTIPLGLQLSASGNNNASCQGQSITVTAISPGVNNWAWTGPAGFTSSQASFTIQNIQPNQQGNYIVTANNSCGSAMDTIAVTVYTLPDSLFVTKSSDSICPGQSVVLSARNGLTNVVWSSGQTGSSINATQAGLYYYTGQDANGCAVYSDSLNVYNAVPPMLNLFGSNPTSVCLGQQTVVLRASSDSAVSITWSPGGSHLDSLVVTSPGEYSVLAVKNGCFVSDSVNVALAPIPGISFNDTVVNTCCINQEVFPVVSGNVVSYQWSDTTSGPSDILAHTGIYTVTVTSDKGCSASGTISFNKVCIMAQATANPDSVQAGNSAMLNVLTAFNGHFIYQWEPADSVSNSTISNPGLNNPAQTDLYTVIVHDTVSGCADTTSVEVYVIYQANYAIPNVFSPKNPNGFNTTWYVINQGGLVTVQDIKVYDRWGIPVFDSERDGTIEWNGYYGGKLQLMGNYVYAIKLKINSTGEEKFIKGNLSLIW